MSAICFNLDQSKILSPGNGLNHKSKREEDTVKRKIDDKQQFLAPLAKDKEENLYTSSIDKPQGMPYLKRKACP